MKYVALLVLITAACWAQSVDLSGPWKLSPTDDPRWAQPGIDDSAWPAITLPQRIRGRVGIFWLRRVVPGVSQYADLAIAMGLVSESYEVYVNGFQVGGTGDIGAPNPVFFQPRWFRLPPGLIRESSPTLIALRISKANISWGALTGGVQDEGPYLIASPAHVTAEVKAAAKSLRLAVTPGLLIAFGQFGIGLFLLVLWFAERERREHLFFAGFLIFGALDFLLAIWTVYTGQSYAWHRYLYQPAAVLLMLSLLQFTSLVLQVRSLSGYVVAGTAVICLAAIGNGGKFSYLQPTIALISWQCFRALRSSARETRLFAFAILLYMCALLNNTVRGGNLLRTSVDLGGMSLAYTNLLQLLFATAMMILLLRRLAADRQEKQRLAAEVEAARAVQQLLLSQSAANGGVYTVETVYEPAQHVGGDFFWVQTDPDGALLVMVGDVSGKGMKAAMLVTLIMGVLRQRAERQPEELLALVNRAIADEMHGGFVTACCVRADVNGNVAIANAGHPSPYRQGQEVDTQSGLPLGVVVNADYTSSSLLLAPGEQLTFVSDGVVEAASATGELFGFDRTREISGKSAAEIALTAQAWGQNDDITVVTVRRNA